MARSAAALPCGQGYAALECTPCRADEVCAPQRVACAMDEDAVADWLQRGIPETCDGTCGGTANGKPCVFPFIHRGYLHTECTVADHGRKWCSVGPSGEWGECHCDCSYHRAAGRAPPGECFFVQGELTFAYELMSEDDRALCANWHFVERRDCAPPRQELFPPALTAVALFLDVLVGHLTSAGVVLLVLRRAARAVVYAFVACFEQRQMWGSMVAVNYVHAPLLVDSLFIVAFVLTVRGLRVMQPRFDKAGEQVETFERGRLQDALVVVTVGLCTVVVFRTTYMAFVVYDAVRVRVRVMLDAADETFRSRYVVAPSVAVLLVVALLVGAALVAARVLDEEEVSPYRELALTLLVLAALRIAGCAWWARQRTLKEQAGWLYKYSEKPHAFSMQVVRGGPRVNARSPIRVQVAPARQR